MPAFGSGVSGKDPILKPESFWIFPPAIFHFHLDHILSRGGVLFSLRLGGCLCFKNVISAAFFLSREQRPESRGEAAAEVLSAHRRWIAGRGSGELLRWTPFQLPLQMQCNLQSRVMSGSLVPGKPSLETARATPGAGSTLEKLVGGQWLC